MIAENKIAEALDVLNEAARDKKRALQKIISEKYSDLRDSLEDEGSKVASAIGQAKETAGKIISQADEKIKNNPWPYLAGIAVGFLVLGLLFGARRSE